MRNAIIIVSSTTNPFSVLTQELCGQNVIEHMVEKCRGCDVDKTVIYANDEQVLCENVSVSNWQSEEEFNQNDQILCVDAHLPLLSQKILNSMFEIDADVVLLTGKWQSDSVGCVMRDVHGEIKAIGSESGLSEYIYPVCVIKGHLFEKTSDNFTDTLKSLIKATSNVKALNLQDPNEVLFVDNLVSLAKANQVLKLKINEQLMNQGVILIDPTQTYISADSKIGAGSVIYPQVTIRNSNVGKNCIITNGSWLEKATLGDDCRIESSKIIKSSVGSKTEVGPYAHFRGYTEVGEGCRIGNFVEFKKTVFGNGSKCAHLTYLGDALVGEKVNIGCGVVSVNYDGKNKHKTIIGDGAFIGSNVNLIAPIEIGSQAVVAAGSTVSASVNKEELVIERAPVVVKPGYGKRYLTKEKK